MGVPCCVPVVFGAVGVDGFDVSTESAYISGCSITLSTDPTSKFARGTPGYFVLKLPGWVDILGMGQGADETDL